MKPENDDAWWSKDGVRFECQGSGNCCVSRGEYGFVYLTLEDRRNMAKLLGLSTSAFTRLYCRMTDGVWHLKDGATGDCLFLEGKRCRVYQARPVQCRTWPFWPEVMNAKTWTKEVAAFCPGVGRGPVRTPEEIRSILDEQRRWETDLTGGK